MAEGGGGGAGRGGERIREGLQSRDTTERRLTAVVYMDGAGRIGRARLAKRKRKRKQPAARRGALERSGTLASTTLGLATAPGAAIHHPRARPLRHPRAVDPCDTGAVPPLTTHADLHPSPHSSSSPRAMVSVELSWTANLHAAPRTPMHTAICAEARANEAANRAQKPSAVPQTGISEETGIVVADVGRLTGACRIRVRSSLNRATPLLTPCSRPSSGFLTPTTSCFSQRRKVLVRHGCARIPGCRGRSLTCGRTSCASGRARGRSARIRT